MPELKDMTFAELVLLQSQIMTEIQSRIVDKNDTAPEAPKPNVFKFVTDCC